MKKEDKDKNVIKQIVLWDSNPGPRGKQSSALLTSHICPGTCLFYVVVIIHLGQYLQISTKCKL